jgi:hypothetical protein
MYPPKSIIILFVGMAAIAIVANFLKGAGTAGATQITPAVVASQSEQTPAVTPLSVTPTTSAAQTQTPSPSRTSSQVRASSSPVAAPIKPPSIIPRGDRELREDD